MQSRQTWLAGTRYLNNRAETITKRKTLQADETGKDGSAGPVVAFESQESYTLTV